MSLYERLSMLGGAVLIFPLQMAEFLQFAFASRWALPLLGGGLISLSLLFLLFAIRFCTRKVSRLSSASIETRHQAAFRRKFLTPILWKDFFRRAMARKLDRNPFVWLEYRAAWSRAARWAAILLLITVETFLLIQNAGDQDFIEAQFPILCALILLMTLKSSSSFQREKENGAFELILVAPITEARLVSGRLRAVGGYYLPVILTLAVFAVLGHSWVHPNETSFITSLSLWLSLCSVPAAGLFFVLRCKTFFSALLWTIGLAILGPLILWHSFTGTIWFAAHRLNIDLAFIIEHTVRDLGWLPLLTILLYHLTLFRLARRAATKLLHKRSFIF